MNNARRRRLCIAALLVALPTLAADTPKCPIDNMPMWFTGKTRVDSGKLLQLWKCPKGHEIWVVK